ncbi:ATP-binding protein [Sphingorhabdus sp.]|uniref:sensor histidine kinase n=1 Tax=Sphingorhabdus sp. TaxID=1902408 RepID=UPI0035AFCAB6
MALDIALQTPDSDRFQLRWSRKLSLTSRILAVNLFALALMASGLFFLDSYRTRLVAERQEAAETQVVLLASAIARMSPADAQATLSAFAKNGKSRVRLYNQSGEKTYDSAAAVGVTFQLADPSKEPWRKTAARWMDMGFDFLVQAPDLASYQEPSKDNAAAWPELRQLKAGLGNSLVRFAPDLTHVVSAATIMPDGTRLLTTGNPRDVRSLVRAERFSIGIFMLVVLVVSVLLSLFLARTIVRPLQYLARAAVRVRLGRSPDVTIPRMPSRRDEIGMLARALSDMSSALRQRIDATEAFAADVAHEIKNPLASLRSALDGIDNVSDPALRAQLMAVAHADVQRMDRLISDISDASRIDAQLAKANFEPIDMGDMIEQLLEARENRAADGTVRIAFARPRRGITVVMGEDIRIERVLTNLLDNAVSFSPPDGVVEISATRSDDEVIIRISDQGPGIPPHERETVFRRFHSARPENEGFGKHSGLGLAIARTIIEGHHGSISVDDREDGLQGACFRISLPAAQAPEPAG